MLDIGNNGLKKLIRLKKKIQIDFECQKIIVKIFDIIVINSNFKY